MTIALSLRGSGRFLKLSRIVSRLEGHGGFDVRILPCNGPAAALMARRGV